MLFFVNHSERRVTRIAWAVGYRNSGSIPGRGKNFPLLRVQSGSGANLASYSRDTRASFCRGKAAGA